MHDLTLPAAVTEVVEFLMLILYKIVWRHNHLYVATVNATDIPAMHCVQRSRFS